MSERGFDMRRNGVGILLFAVGVFFAVLFVQAFTSDVPISEAGGTAALAALWIDSIGLLAGFVFCTGIAILGARMFLVDAPSGSPVRSAGGLAGIAVGLSILAGSISAGAGGALGRAIGGGITGATHVAIGALVGIAVIAFSVWAVWLQGPRVAAEPEIEDDGVTAAEAAALIPTESNRTLADTRKTERASTWTAPPSPYPEDVRRRGEIPAGAKPLDPTHDRTAPQSGQSGAPTSSVYRWTAARTDEPADPAGADLARAIASAAHVEPVDDDELDGDLAEPFAQALIAEERVELVLALAEPEAEDALEEADLDDELLEVKALDAPTLDAALFDEEPLDRIPEIPAAHAERLPEIARPSWEQSSLFAETEEPPVDAYGTPLALVDELAERSRETEPAAELEEEAELDDELDEDEDEDSDEDDSDEDSEEDEDETDEQEYDEDSDDEDAEEDIEDEVYAEGDDDEELEAEAAELEEAPREPALAEAAAAPRLKDVVLTPHAAASPHTPSAPTLPADRQKLLVEVGCLFVDRGRVAVSMLQRQYSMDFDDACKVLDELQEMGLIGPYLGGQRRDILLTRDQWLERVASS